MSNARVAETVPQRLKYALLSFVMCGLLWANGVEAQRELVDRVIAMVDEQAILLSEVVREMNIVQLQRNLGRLSEAEQDELFKQVLNDMVNDQLLVARAREKGLEVGEQELRDAVDEEIRKIKEQLGGEEQYRQQLASEGLTEAQIREIRREQRHNQILTSRLIQSELRRSVNISDAQVEDFYYSKRDSLPPVLFRSPERLKLAHILSVPNDEGQQEQAIAKAQEALNRVRGGEDFAAVAKQVSEWPTAGNGGSIGKFRYGDFDSQRFDEAVSKLQPGDVSPVFQTKFGLMIVKLESRDADVMTARHIVVKMDATQNAIIDAFDRADEIRRRVVAGESFEELARQYSDDPNSRDSGGTLEQEWAREELLPQFQSATDSVEVGGISKVVQGPTGFHVFKVLSRQEAREMSFEETREGVRSFLEQRELEQRFRAYVADLRQRFHVEIKS